MSVDGEQAAVAGLAHELRVLQHADVRRGAADRPPYNRFSFFEFLIKLRECPIDAAVEDGFLGRNLEEGYDDELEVAEEKALVGVGVLTWCDCRRFERLTGLRC